ncbi:hypothetical protein GCM10023185_06210 [Hymenobacter saemangeumensis]|uniref:T9SS type A sorting domain-containing protein n=1 Tax=Hymenobacter saemangeumensis TaxID=1084522 RepID=A0ABP8I1P7_9BACT
MLRCAKPAFWCSGLRAHTSFLLLALLFLLGGAGAIQASPYYWVPAPTGTGTTVSGSGAWNELAHWAASSGGSGGAYSQVPQSTDDVYFDANSFNGNNQRVSLAVGATPTCRNLTWSGNVRGGSFSGGGTMEVNGDIRYTPLMGTPSAINFRLLAPDAGHVIDMQNVNLGNGSFTFANAQGQWTFISPVNMALNSSHITLQAAARVSLGSTSISCSYFSAPGTVPMVLDLGSSSVTVLRPNPLTGWVISNPNLSLVAGTGTIRLGNSTFNNSYFLFQSTPLSYHRVSTLPGNAVNVNALNASFQNLEIGANTAVLASIAIAPGGALTVAPDVTLRLPASGTVAFGAGATLASGGSCAGQGVVQSASVGARVTLARSGGWATAPLSHLALQDLAFTAADGTTPGGAVGSSCADDGNNTGIALASAPVSDLYWVGGSGSWHDPTHWASSSGGSSSGNSCLPGVLTNVHFDANSFTAPGQRVTLDGAAALCRNMSWAGVSNQPDLRTAPGFNTLAVRGSLTLAASMTQTLPIALFVGGSTAGSTYTLTTAGQQLAATLWVRCPGSALSLQDAVTTTSRLCVEAGALNTNSQAVSAFGFTAGFAYTGSNTFIGSTGVPYGVGLNSTAATILNLGGSVLRITAAGGAHTWDASTTVQLNAGTSTINLLTSASSVSFVSGRGLRYATVVFGDAPLTLAPGLVNGNGTASTYEQLRFEGPAIISAGITITGSLRLTPGRRYSFSNASVHTFAPGATFDAVGNCSAYVDIVGPVNGGPVRFVGSTAVPLQYVQLRNAAFSGGASWQAQASLDNGLNTGIAFTPAPSRRLYWVGNGGRWSDPAHWSTSSGGASGSCVPSAFDDVVLDSNSFTTTGQVLELDQPVASCRSIDCRTVVNNPTLTSLFDASTNNALNVYGSVSWAPAPNMTLALQGDLNLLGSGTLTSAGQRLNGRLQVNAPGGTVTLADDFVQQLTGYAITYSSNTAWGFTLTAGTLNTNSQRFTVNDFFCTSNLAKTLNLGASRVEVTRQSWRAQAPSTLTLNASNSVIYLLGIGNASFQGGGQGYNRVVVNSLLGGLTGNNTIRSLRIINSGVFIGNTTITDSLRTSPGQVYRFEPNSTTTFSANAVVLLPGTGTNPITLQSTVPGSLFTWTKPAGGESVCADYTYIRDSRATGGAYFEGGRNGANNQGNNPGWSFGFPPRAAYRGRYVCPAEGPHTMRFTFTSFDITNNTAATLAAAQFPLTMVLKNLTTNAVETISVPGPVFDYLIPTSTASAQYQVLSLSTSASGGCGTIENTDPNTFAVASEVVLNGAAGAWMGGGVAANGDWFDCQNWANGAVPTLATDVVVNQNAATVSLGNGRVAAVPLQPSLNQPGATVRSLTVPAGASFTAGPAARLTVAGNWQNSGSTVLDPASVVTFAGAAQQVVGNGQFGSVVVNNPAGLLLQTANASSSGTLTLTAGRITTGAFQWVHSNPAPGSLSGYSASSYVLGNLRRAVAPGVTGTYAFPVGLPGAYALLEIDDKGLTGLSTLTARFGAKPGTDAGLNCAEGPTTPRYQSVHPAGVWTLTPDTQPTAGNYDVRAGLAPFYDLNDNLFAVLKRPDASINAADWSTGGGTLNADNGSGRRVADGYALRKGLTSFSQFGLGRTNFSPLPVTLVAFTAVRKGADGLLTWRTATELNSASFEVQASTNGLAWQTLSRQPAAGTSNSAHDYRYLDANLARYSVPTVYYRLRQVDVDGTTHYSPVVALSLQVSAWAVEAFPRPFESGLTARLSTPEAGPATLVVLDATGREVLRRTVPAALGSQLIGLPEADALPAGLYTLRISQGSHAGMVRVVHH